jgi:hypothetical protein
MNEQPVIDSYVSDVVRRLPRRQRADVGAELRALLLEELAGRSAEPVEADVLALLNAFGRPSDVADRYRPAGLTIIDPADGRAFVKAAAGGVGVIWLIGLAYAVQKPSIVDGLRVFFQVAVSALIWPGFLVVWFGVAAWARRRWPGTAAWKPRPAERDAINRFGLATAVIFAALGTAVLLSPTAALDLVVGGRLSDPARAAFAYDSEFVRLRGPALLAMLVASIIVLVAVLIRGRWEPGTRRAHLAVNIVMSVVLTWVLFGGNVFQATPTDQMFKLAVAGTTVGAVIDLVVRLRRRQQRVALATTPTVS